MTEQTTPPAPALPPVPDTPPPPPSPPVAEPEPAPGKRDRRVLRAVLRWSTAVAVFAAVGSVTAYGVTRVERTDVPGLATESDGRWDYPALTAAPLPAGSPGPFAEENAAGAHYADLRDLVLPAPEGAKADKALRGKDGWLPTDVFLREYRVEEDRDSLRRTLVDTGLRHIAARGWTTPDGTRTRIYLLHFDTAAVVDELQAVRIAPALNPAFGVRGEDLSVPAETFPDERLPDEARFDDVRYTFYVEPEPYGDEQVRQAYLGVGDVLAVVLQSRKGGARVVPFQQTVVLQTQLLH
ncbi:MULTISPECIES: hypothetical protein [Streptomyces]|uniref:hypothetical protein n=1 Tax=Streptomyces TaxID=1883 RepID=UPI001292107D|nr:MULTISPECIES: hypothetical protein [Streptomyces]MCX5036936.1 hypothetical protein [Streptomyces coelicoflavus]QFX83124.1 hypothetical protein GEV49_21140 [Streptomyces sp. SYP-A7193]